MHSDKITKVLGVCSDELRSRSSHFYLGVAYAELRVHPDAHGEIGVRLQFEDGSVMWLVAEED